MNNTFNAEQETPGARGALSPAGAELAISVIAQADRDHPADSVLREALRSAQGLPRTESAAVSRAVFSHFRWRGWLDPNRTPQASLRQALGFAAAFRKKPGSIPDAELLERAIPEWAKEEVAVTGDWVRSIQREPLLWIRSRASFWPEIQRELVLLHRDRLPNAGAHAGDVDLFRRVSFQSGQFELQDIASQAVGWLCAPQPGQTWWDACCGEGGKLLHLSDLMKNQGLIWASDRSLRRLAFLKKRTARAGCFNYRAVPWEGKTTLPTKTRFDGVLVDAPCSGLGTWGRNPHARWTTRPDDVHELAVVQLRLLQAAAVAVKPGGRLVYAVCTLTRKETDGVADGFERHMPGFVPEPVADPFRRPVPPKARHWFWPKDTDGNGMYVAIWRRI